MNSLQNGQFFGENNQRRERSGLTLTDTVYSRERVDWHFHENPHFTLITRGDIRQGTRREVFECPVDTMLFHNRQEPHYSIKPPGLTRGFQVEIHPQWTAGFEIDLDRLPNCARIMHPGIKLLFHALYKEAKLTDDVSALAIDGLLVAVLTGLQGEIKMLRGAKPAWVSKAREILHDRFDQPLTLRALATELDLHWAHLSRDFPRYFHCTFGEYVRKIRVDRSIALLRDPARSLTDIAQQCGFADQSHFIRSFREFLGVTPKTFRKLSG